MSPQVPNPANGGRAGASAAASPASEPDDAELEILVRELERGRAHSGFNADNTRRLYELLERCRQSGRARQALRILAMLVHLHYCENDEFELRERSREGVELAQRLGDDRTLRHFLGYWNKADAMQRDFEHTWATVLVLALLGALGAATFTLQWMTDPQRAR